MKKNCKTLEKEQKEKTTQDRENDQNTIAVLSDEDLAVLLCEEDQRNIVDPYIEWVIELVASYCVASNKKFFTSYKVKDFGKVKMDNQSYVDIVVVRDVYIQTDVGCTLTLRDM